MIIEWKPSFKLERYHHVLLLLVIFHSSTTEAATNGLQPGGTQCACAGDRLIYNCNVVGGTATRWRGTAFDCPLGITLRHSQFAEGITGTCNNGDLVGRSIGVVNDCYTSQLNVTVRESFNNKTVQCTFTSLVGMTTIIGESSLRVVSATNPYPPPDNLYLADAQPGTLVFKWTPVISNCSTLYIQYNIIITSDCGTCPTVTNTTTATCSDLQLSTNAVICHFSVSSYACGFFGNPTSPTEVTLKVPDAPQVEIIPSYSNDSQATIKLLIVKIVKQTEDQFYISSNISGSPISYTAYVFSISGISFSVTVDSFSCKVASGCPIVNELLSSYCSQSTTINVTISAANKLGEGPHSSPFVIECINNFVQVVYRETSIISCVFLNQSDTSEKTCCVIYGPCDQMELNTQICNRYFPYSIRLEVADRSRYCYTITASNESHTVKVEGILTLGNNHGGNSNTAASITAGVVIPIVLILGTVMLSVSLLWVTCYPQNPLKPYLIPYNVPATSKLYKVNGDRYLRDFVIEVSDSQSFRRGHTYYEFTNEVENILEGKEVLLQDRKNSEKWFRLAPPEKVAAGRLKLYGEGVARISFGDPGPYRVFIQSFGSGARHLPHGSWILYNDSEDQGEPDNLPLVPICSKYFAHRVINSEKECTVQQFCEQNGLNTTAFNIFLTVDHLPEGMRDQPPRDVILMDRESRKLFTGPLARQMLDPNNGGESQHENEKWKVFVLLEMNKQGLILTNGSEVLYQDSNYQKGMFTVLDVDEDCVRLSKFIETNLNNCQYEDGKAFYEVMENEDETEREEDLLYYKKILRPEQKQLSCGELELQSLIEYFYAIPGVPSLAVKSEQLRLEHHRIFIQSTSQGSRCLKKGEKILYLKGQAAAII